MSIADLNLELPSDEEMDELGVTLDENDIAEAYYYRTDRSEDDDEDTENDVKDTENKESTEPRKCRVCGCTDDHACEGGCYWVEDDLCSSCVGAEEPPEREPVMSVCPFCESQVPIQLDIAAEGQYDPEYYAMNNCTCEDAQEWRRREKGRYERNKFEESVELQLSAVTGMDAEDECFRAIKALCLSVFDEDIDSFSVNLNYAAKLNVKSKNGMLEFERTEVHKQKRTA